MPLLIAAILFALWWMMRGGPKQVMGYIKGQAFPLTVYPIGGGHYLAETPASAFQAMRAAADADGLTLGVNSAFRFNEKQAQLYAAWKAGTGNLAAPPGYSNHQAGLSVDIAGCSTRDTANYQWLAQYAATYGFVNDVQSEPWHWTWKG